MIASIATVTMAGALPIRIKAAADAGFGAIELFDTDLQTYDGDSTAVRRLADEAGLEIASYFPLRDVDGVPVQHSQATRKRAAAWLDEAVALGASMVMMCSSTASDASGNHSDIVEDLTWLADMAKERDIRLAYEALSWGVHINDYRDAATLVQQLDHSHFGLVLDSFHILARQQPVDDITNIPSEHIFLVQVSDAPRLNIDFVEWSRHHRTLPGHGSFDLAAFTAAVKATGYDGVFSLECFSDDLKKSAAEEIARTGLAALTDLWNGKTRVQR